MAPWPYPLWIAHRGAGKLAPENTLAAFRLGASHGYRAFECDVKLSADGVPFLLHDDTLDRTTGDTGVAGQRPWSELSRLDAGGWLNRHYAGEPLPSFDAVVTYVLRNGFVLDVEIKPTPGLEHHTGVEVAKACAARWRGAATPPPLLSSFRPDALQGAQEAAPELPRALLLETLWDRWADVARALGCVAVITDHVLMTAELAGQLRAAGLRALCYTVNDADEARRLLGLPGGGIDGIITDAVDRFSPSAAGLFD